MLSTKMKSCPSASGIQDAVTSTAIIQYLWTLASACVTGPTVLLIARREPRAISHDLLLLFNVECRQRRPKHSQVLLFIDHGRTYLLYYHFNCV